MGRNAGGGESGIEVLVGFVLAILVAVVGGVWLGAWTSTLLSGHLFTGRLDESASVLGAQLQDLSVSPAVLWGDPNVPSKWLVWPITLGWVVVIGLAIVFVVKVFVGPTSGFVARKRLGVDPEARFANAKELASLRMRCPTPGRFLLGRIGSQTFASSNTQHASGWTLLDRARVALFSKGRSTADGGVAIFGMTQSGKSQHSLSALRTLSAAGAPMILSSVKGDILEQMLAQRRQVGKVGVFDPTGKLQQAYEERARRNRPVPAGWDRRLCVGWSPLDGVVTYDDAAAAAHTLSEGAPEMGAESNGDFWTLQSAMLLTPLIWIAARSGRDMGDVAMWVLTEARVDPSRPDAPLPEPVELLHKLLNHSDVGVQRDADKADGVLVGIWNKAPQTVGSTYATASGIIKPWATEEGGRSSTGQLANLEWLLDGQGQNTLFISAPPAEQRQLRPVLAGAVSSILDAVFRHVEVHGRIDPPLVVFLDEIGNAPLARLPEFLSTLSSAGVVIVTVWQDIAQVEHAYGKQAGSILANSRHILLFGGTKDRSTLDWVQGVLGEEGANTMSRTNNVGELLGGSVSSSEQRVALTPSNVLREMPSNKALLISANNRPAEVEHISDYKMRAFDPLRDWSYPPASTLGLPTVEGTVNSDDKSFEVVEHTFNTGYGKAIGKLGFLARKWLRPKPGNQSEGGPTATVDKQSPSLASEDDQLSQGLVGLVTRTADQTNEINHESGRVRREMNTSGPVVIDASSGLENFF